MYAKSIEKKIAKSAEYMCRQGAVAAVRCGPHRLIYYWSQPNFFCPPPGASPLPPQKKQMVPPKVYLIFLKIFIILLLEFRCYISKCLIELNHECCGY